MFLVFASFYLALRFKNRLFWFKLGLYCAQPGYMRLSLVLLCLFLVSGPALLTGYCSARNLARLLLKLLSSATLEGAREATLISRLMRVSESRHELLLIQGWEGRGSGVLCDLIWKYRRVALPRLSHPSIYNHYRPFIAITIMAAQPHNRGDALDSINQQYSRMRTPSNHSQGQGSLPRQDLAVRNMYRMQLDELMEQKQQQKRVEREQQDREREQYNRRMQEGTKAERLKDLSYKNYYNMLLDNQSNVVKQYGVLGAERDSMKEQHIQKGIQEEKQRSEQWWEAEHRRQQNMKQVYRDQLANQINEHERKGVVENESRVKQQEEFKKVTYSPYEIAKYERDRKIMEMSKYKEDLDKTSPTTTDKFRRMAGEKIVSNSSPATVDKNDFNTTHQTRHNPMTNPMPYNVQNPYILKEMMRRQPSRSQYLT